MDKEIIMKPLINNVKTNGVFSEAERQISYRSWHLHYYMKSNLTGRQIDVYVEARTLIPFTCADSDCNCQYEKTPLPIDQDEKS